jgi:phosphoserine phosphatase
MKFPLGRLLSTPGALAALAEANENPLTYIIRHAAGDWGDLSREDLLANAQSLKDGTRLLSAYHLKDGTKIWIITEADRSATTILLPGEY